VNYKIKKLRSGLEVIENIVWLAATSNPPAGGEHSVKRANLVRVQVKKSVRAQAQ
jgi:hypothetical protein